jgi:hypothetical protein
VVTHLTTNPPVSCLNRAERTGSLVLKILWSYVEDIWKCTKQLLAIKQEANKLDSTGTELYVKSYTTQTPSS